jgi:hypothetical protein
VNEGRTKNLEDFPFVPEPVEAPTRLLGSSIVKRMVNFTLYPSRPMTQTVTGKIAMTNFLSLCNIDEPDPRLFMAAKKSL